MKKQLLLIATAIATVTAFGQDSGGWCGTDAHQQKIFDANPGLEEEMHEHLSRVAGGMGPSIDRDAIYYIPCVFHIIHDNGVGNISDEQVQSAIDQLNEDYNALNSDFDNARNTATAPFAPYASDMHIQFGLAKVDPDGNCTNGIQRRNSPAGSYNADDGIKTYAGGGLDQWPRDEYLNIWVVNSIDSDGSAGMILGYAQFPYGGGWGSPASTYGIVIRHDRVGTTGTATTDRTLTHEVGHCLGFLHTFQGGCHSGDCSSNGDYCCDTPPQSEAFWTCSSSQNSCGIPSGDVYGIDALDQWENFMSYSPCQYMFTEDQKTIAHSNFTDISFLANLTSLANANDKEILSAGPLCQADFLNTDNVICAGGSVTFDDVSYHNVTGRTWTFTGGTPASSTSENPTVVYNTPGIYDVTLEVTDGSSTISKTETAHIIVLGDPGQTIPYTEGFELITSLPDYDEMLIVNEDGGQQFQVYSGAASTGSYSARLSNFGVTNGTKDAIESTPIDLSTLDPSDDVILSFKYAYKRRSSSNNEALKVYISKDCGETWILRKIIDGDDLGPEISSSSYIPSSENDWYQVDITNITSSYYVSNFRYKLEFTNDNGNNIFIDDINIYDPATVGLEEIDAVSSWSVYPNPTTNIVNIQIDGVMGADYVVDLYNIMGEKVGNVYSGYLNSGMNTLNYDMSNLPKGIYVVRVASNGEVLTKRIIKQ